MRLTTKKLRKKLYGRSDELRELRQLKSEACKGRVVPVAIVGGSPGTGKSALILEAFLDKNPNDSTTTLYGSGKFEEGSETPFSAMQESISQFVQRIQLLPNSSSVIATVNMKLETQDKRALIGFCTDMGSIFGILENAPAPPSFLHRASMAGLAALEYSLKRFFCELCKAVDVPVVWVLDDLQWMDSASLSVLRIVLADGDHKNLIFVGSYRTAEIRGDVAEWLKDGIEKGFTNLLLDELGEEVIEELLSDMLNAEDNVRDLAVLVHKRTGGNIMSVLQLVEYMYAQKLLVYSPLSMRWTWDAGKIQEQTVVSSNILSIVIGRIQLLPANVQRCLQVAAFMGYWFDLRMLYIALEPDMDDESIRLSVERALDEGLLERASSEEYRFAHDQIYDTALNLTTKLEKPRLGYLLGTSLSRAWIPDGADLREIEQRKIFLCTDQLNTGRTELSTQPNRLLQLAHLNHEAARRCTQLNAYFPAARYANNAIELIEHATPHPWINEFSLMLELHTYLAEVSLCIGHFEEIPRLAEAVLEHTGADSDLAFRIHLVSILRLCRMNEGLEAIMLATKVMEELGERWPGLDPSESKVKRRLDHTKRRLQGASTAKLSSLPKMEDKCKSFVQQVISTVLPMAFFIELKGFSAILACRSMEIVLDYGLDKSTPKALLLTAARVFSEEEEDFELCLKLVEVSRELSQDDYFADDRIKIQFWAQMFRHWREPHSVVHDDALKHYEEAMKRGEVQAAFEIVLCYTAIYYDSGMDLRPLVKDSERLFKIMLEYGLKSLLLHALPNYQAILNLTGETGNILDMHNGTATNDYRNKLGWNENERPGEEAQHSYSMQIYCYCEEFEKAGEMYDKLVDIDVGIVRCWSMWHNRVFFFALVAMKRAKKASLFQRKKWLKAAKSHMKQIQNWVVERKAINMVNKLMILEAENLTLSRKKVDEGALVEAYDRAIQAASKSGFCQDAGLAAALAARAVKQRDQKEHYASLAQEMYTMWGAIGVVNHLQETSELHMQEASSRTCSESSSSTRRGLRSRERFEEDLTEQHRSNIEMLR